LLLAWGLGLALSLGKGFLKGLQFPTPNQFATKSLFVAL
jgi:hypothetical protein